MNYEQYLLTCLAEEAAELAQAALKASRFGLDDDFYNIHELRPREMIKSEFVDLWAIVRMMHDCGMMPDCPSEMEALVQAKISKISKVKRFMDYSRDRGRVQ